MSEQNFSRYIPTRLLAGLAATSLALGVASPAASAESVSPISQPSAPGYLNLDQLPGHNIQVTAAVRQALRASAIDLYSAYASSDPSYTPAAVPGCSAEKVSINGANYLSTAAHCEESLTKVPTGVLNPATFPSPEGALNFLDSAFTAGESFTADDPLKPIKDRQTIATIGGISVDTRGVDAALLQATSADINSKQSDPSLRQYNSIPSLSYTNNLKLVRGQQVAMFAMPQSTNFVPVSEIGTYVGRINQPTYDPNTNSTQTRKLDVVVTNPEQPYNDACFYGASGSSFAVKVGNKAAISGPLSVRINSKYDPYLGDVRTLSSSDPSVTLKDALTSEKLWRDEVEAELHVNINPNSTICKYTVMTKQVQDSLVAGFKYPAPQLQDPNKGGGPTMKLRRPASTR